MQRGYSQLAVIIAFVSLGFFFVSSGAFAAGPEHPNEDAAQHLAQAARYRREAKELQEAIERYRVMREVYEKGSQERRHGFTRPGRERMIERTERVIQHFTQAKQEMESLANEHEALAKEARASADT